MTTDDLKKYEPVMFRKIRGRIVPIRTPDYLKRLKPAPGPNIAGHVAAAAAFSAAAEIGMVKAAPAFIATLTNVKNVLASGGRRGQFFSGAAKTAPAHIAFQSAMWGLGGLNIYLATKKARRGEKGATLAKVLAGDLSGTVAGRGVTSLYQAAKIWKGAP